MGEGEPNQPLRRTLQDYMANIGPRYFDALARPNVQTTNVEIRASLIHLIHENKFHALDHKDPYAHLTTFIRIYIFFEEFPTMGKPISPLDILLFKWTVVIFSIFLFVFPSLTLIPSFLPRSYHQIWLWCHRWQWQWHLHGDVMMKTTSVPWGILIESSPFCNWPISNPHPSLSVPCCL